MYKIKYFDTPFWSVAAAAEKGGGGWLACWQITCTNIMPYIYSTTPNRYTLSQHNTIAGNVKFWLKTAEQREITPAPLYSGEPCCKYWGVTSMVMLCQDWSQQVEHMQVPKGRDQVSGVVGKYRFWDSSTREKTPATLCILWWGGQVWGGGGRGTVLGGWPWQTSHSGIQYTPRTPILSAYSTTKRDNSSGWPDTVYCGEEERRPQSPVLGCYIYSYIIYNLNLSHYHYLPSKGISLWKKKLKKSCTSQELWSSVLWEEGKTSLLPELWCYI